MKVALMRLLRLAVLSQLWTAALPAGADAGLFFGNGQDLHQITSKSIHLASIDVTITLGQGIASNQRKK